MAANRAHVSSGPELGDGLDAAVRVFRTAAWAWLATVSALSFSSVERPVAVGAGVVAAGAVTAAWWLPLPLSALPTRSWRQRLVPAELVVGAFLVGADGWVYDDQRPHSFGSVWPVAGVLAVAVRAGHRRAVLAGLGLGAARGVGELLVDGGEWSASRALAVTSTGVLFALAGWAAAWAAHRVEVADRLLARSEARAEVAAELHDGVLQTLAVIQRRSTDDELVRLARSQEAALRRYLSGPEETDAGQVPVEHVLRAASAEAAERFGLRVEVAAVPPLPAVGSETAGAVRGAVGEALANVAKHAGTERAVVFAEASDGRLLVSVQDHGDGFDTVGVHERGIASSVRRRIEGLGGTVDVRSRPGTGTTLSLDLPLEAR